MELRGLYFIESQGLRTRFQILTSIATYHHPQPNILPSLPLEPPTLSRTLHQTYLYRFPSSRISYSMVITVLEKTYQLHIWGCPDYTYEGKLVILPVNTNVNGTLYIATQYWMA